MAWNAPKPSYAIKRPLLSDLVRGPNGNSNTNELRLGMQLYHQWCTQLLTIRRWSIACITFLLSLFLLYLLTLPVLLFNPSARTSYLSLSGLWTAICISALSALAAYFRAHWLTAAHCSHSHSLYALALLPLFTFFICSLHSQFISASDSDSDSAHSTAQTPTLSALFCAYILIEHVCTVNPLIFHTLQPSRSLFMKQLIVRLTASAILRALVLSTLGTFVLALPFATSFSSLTILFALILSIESVTRRLLTENADLSAMNGVAHPLVRDGSNTSRCIDVRLMALTRAHCADYDRPSERDFFAALALSELRDVVQFDANQRRRMFATPAYLGVVVSVLLSEVTTMMHSVYDAVYGEAAVCARARRAMEQAQWAEGVGRCAGVVSFLVLHSLEEDELGVMQEWLERVLCVLLECVDVLDQRVKNGGDGRIRTSARLQRRLLGLRKAMEAALARIIGCMHAHLGEIKLPSKNAMRLMSYLDQH